MNTPRELRRAYANIPPVPCRPRCGDCCGPAPMQRMEWERVKDLVPPGAIVHRTLESDGPYVPAGAFVVLDAASGMCGFLSRDGNRACTIYDKRPLVCRLFGAVRDVANLACEHGCLAAKPIGPKESFRKAMRYMRETQ
jgi:Fe-S-cluster containining protein